MKPELVATRAPISARFDYAYTEPAPTLLLMLPGARDTAQDFFRHGFIDALRQRGAACDVGALDTHVDHYLEHSIVERLHHDVIAPLHAKSGQSIWLLGISLGALGCLRYARVYPEHIAGIIVLAPFLATRGLIAEVHAAGGLAAWEAGDIASDHEREFLHWLKSVPLGQPPFNQFYLGYGVDDRFVLASKILAQRLPPQRSLALAGGHDWPSWRGLWQAWLARGNFWGAAS